VVVVVFVIINFYSLSMVENNKYINIKLRDKKNIIIIVVIVVVTF